ncbi:MAG: CynX/NimT family MFS transporter [Granulosicoccus sp.]
MSRGERAVVERTHWGAIGLLFFAACTLTLHIGKAPPALPVLRQLWELSLTQTGYIVSLYSFMIAISGLLLGVLVRRTGYCTMAIAGVGIVGVGSIIGAQANGLSWLLLGRMVEGFGWIIAAVSLPSLFSALSLSGDRALVAGIWGAFVPVGAGAMLLLAPVFQYYGGWQLSWWFAGISSLFAAVIVYKITDRYSSSFTQLRAVRSRVDFSDLKKPLVWLLSGCFLAYSFQFLAVTSFLPTLFIETSSLTLSTASWLVAVVIISNAVGNVAAGYLVKSGVGHVPLLVVGALSMGLCALVVYTPSLSLPLRLLCALGFSVFGGLIPGTLFITMPKAASSAVSLGLLVGLMMQFSGVGQLLGGVAVPAAVEYFVSWQAAGYVALGAGIIGSLLACLTRTPMATH